MSRAVLGVGGVCRLRYLARMPDREILSDIASRGPARPNPFAGGGLDRAPHLRRDPAALAIHLAHPGTGVVPVWRSRSLVVARPGEDGLEAGLLAPAAAGALCEPREEWVFLGLREGRALFAAGIADDGDARQDPGSPGAGDASADPEREPRVPVEGARFRDLRGVGALLSQADGSLLACARALVTWQSRHRFCGACGHPTVPHEAGHVRRCGDPACGLEHFPRTDPAIIVLVADGQRCLLGRKAFWPDGVYSTLAGFVEPGESLAEAVRREVLEESGIEVGDVRYHSSQPWPFPSSIMLGFHAVRAGGDVRVDTTELADARWFHRDEVVDRETSGLRLPGRVSIARRLIEDWLGGEVEPISAPGRSSGRRPGGHGTVASTTGENA